MGFSVNTNVSALNTFRNLTNTQNSQSKSLEKLSSGLRINRAADDAAGLSIAEGLKAQVNGYSVAARNAQDGISVVQAAEGALGESQSILQRMRDLAVQASSDTNNADARTAIKSELDELANELHPRRAVDELQRHQPADRSGHGPHGPGRGGGRRQRQHHHDRARSRRPRDHHRGRDLRRLPSRS